MQKPYAGRLRQEFKNIEYFADELLFATNDATFFRIAINNFLVLIRTSQACDSFYSECLREKQLYDERLAELEELIPKEIEDVIQALITDLKEEGLLEEPDIQSYVDKITTVRAHPQDCVMPSYLEKVYEMIQSLIHELNARVHTLNDGKKSNIIQKYAKLRPGSARSAPIIESLTCVPLYQALKKMHDQCNIKNIQRAWIALEYFVLAEWCWLTPYSFFEDKKLEYTSYDTSRGSAKLLALKSYWHEMDVLKRGHDHNNRRSAVADVFPFKTEIYVPLLQLIINGLMFTQVTTSRGHDSTLLLECMMPYSIELQLEDDYYQCLMLLARGTQKDQDRYYKIVGFKNDSAWHGFFKSIIAAQEGASINVCTMEGGKRWTTAAKCLQDFPEPLERLFFEGVNTTTVVVKRKVIYGADLSHEDRQKLVHCIRKLVPLDPPAIVK